MASINWWQVAGNSLLVPFGLMWIVGLFTPGLGRILFGTDWPGNFADPIKKRIAFVSGWCASIAVMLAGCVGGLRIVFNQNQRDWEPAIQQPVWWILIILVLVLTAYAIFLRLKLRR